MRRAIHAALLLGAALVLIPGAALAVPSMMIEVAEGSGPQNLQQMGTGVELGEVLSWSLDNPFGIDGVMVNSWTADLKEDPFVTNNINVTNTTGVTQTFIATVLLPIPVFNYNAVINSSVGVTTTDSNGNNVLSFAKSGATFIYQGTVNGTTALSLDPPGLPLTTASCPVPFPGCTATASTGTAFQAAGPGAATQIGITLTFTLSPGDSAGLTSRFEIVPEPSTALMLVGALLGGAVTRRRVNR